MTLSSFYFKGVEANPLKLKCRLSRHVKNRGIGSKKRRGKSSKIEMPSFFNSSLFNGSILNGLSEKK